MRTIFLSISTVVVFVSAALGQSSFVDGVDLTSPKAPFTMRILGNDLDITDAKLRAGDEHAGYFMMTSRTSELNVSVFFEKVDKCKTSDECRDYVLGLGNPAWGKYQDLKKGRIKDFSYFEFYRPEVAGRPLKMLDMYAQYVAQGYWIDLHISKALYSPADHALFEKVLNSVTFVPKIGEQVGQFSSVRSAADKMTGSWLTTWGTKCKESYSGLSSISKAELTEKVWTDYCTSVNNELGANRSRQLIGVAFTRSLPQKTDRPLAIMAYRSDFANRTSVVELVALLLEKDDRWTVTNYVNP